MSLRILNLRKTSTITVSVVFLVLAVAVSVNGLSFSDPFFASPWHHRHGGGLHHHHHHPSRHSIFDSVYDAPSQLHRKQQLEFQRQQQLEQQRQQQLEQQRQQQLEQQRQQQLEQQRLQQLEQQRLQQLEQQKEHYRRLGLRDSTTETAEEYKILVKPPGFSRAVPFDVHLEQDGTFLKVQEHRRFHAFSELYKIPTNVDVSKITRHYLEDGTLVITLPKVSEPEPAKVTEGSESQTGPANVSTQDDHHSDETNQHDKQHARNHQNQQARQQRSQRERRYVPRKPYSRQAQEQAERARRQTKRQAPSETKTTTTTITTTSKTTTQTTVDPKPEQWFVDDGLEVVEEPVDESVDKANDAVSGYMDRGEFVYY